MEEYQIKIEHCLQRIKEQLKLDGFTYQALADQLDVSLITVKRMLNGNDIAMQKLLKLCDVVGLDFSELWQSTVEHKVQHSIFSQPQDQAFYQYPHLLTFFDELVSGKGQVKPIQEKWQLTDASVHLYLRKLESLDLIQVSVQQHVTLCIEPPMGFGPDSKVIKAQIANALNRVSDNYLKESKPHVFTAVKPLQLSHELRQKMYDELFEVLSRYGELSERYFVDSNHPMHHLVMCDYDATSIEAASAKIININGFD